MKYDEFAFMNQQLAAMLRDGLPLEGALRQLCAGMRRGPLRSELEKLGADLAKGVPLREAARARKLPELYVQMLEIGAQSNDLPAILTMLADHYQRRHVIATRLKGLMVYPVIVLFGAFLLSCFLSFTLTEAARFTLLSGLWYRMQTSSIVAGIWAPPVLLGFAAVVLFIVVTLPRVRRVMRWRMPAFKEASLAQVAAALALMLRSGVSLNNAFGLVEQLERGTPAESEMARLRRRLSAGEAKFADMAAGGNLFPPLFVWLVSQSGEDLPAGFQRAAEMYQSRAAYRTEVLLYSALPCSVIALGMVILFQIRPVVTAFVAMMNALGSAQ